MLKWREEHDVNEIRKRIMGGLQPEQFPRYAVVRRFYPLLKTGSGAAAQMPRCPAATAAACRDTMPVTDACLPLCPTRFPDRTRHHASNVVTRAHTPCARARACTHSHGRAATHSHARTHDAHDSTFPHLANVTRTCVCVCVRTHTHTHTHTHDTRDTDNNGCPIMITLTGLIDPAKLVKAVTLDEIRLYIIYEMEHKLIQLSKLTVETGIMYRALEIHDLNGLGGLPACGRWVLASVYAY